LSGLRADGRQIRGLGFSPKTSLRLAEPKKSVERQLDAKEGLAHREIEEPSRASL
jgi:hypothetical protein